MKLLGVNIQNFQRIELLDIKLDEDLVTEITGENGNGKTSALDAIVAALGGKERRPKSAIRRGAEFAAVVLDLGDIVVESRWTETTDKLVVMAKDGTPYGRAQEKLNGLLGGLAFDPMEFMGLKPKEQRETLLRVMGIDLDDLESRRRGVFERRQNVNRDLKALQAQLDALPKPGEDVPDEEVSVAELTRELDAAGEVKRQNDRQRLAAEGLEKALEQAQRAQDDQRKEVERLRKALAAAEKELTRRSKDLEAASASAVAASTAADALQDPDTTAILEKRAAAEDTNRAVRQKLRPDATGIH